MSEGPGQAGPGQGGRVQRAGTAAASGTRRCYRVPLCSLLGPEKGVVVVWIDLLIKVYR